MNSHCFCYCYCSRVAHYLFVSLCFLFAIDAHCSSENDACCRYRPKMVTGTNFMYFVHVHMQLRRHVYSVTRMFFYALHTHVETVLLVRTRAYTSIKNWMKANEEEEETKIRLIDLPKNKLLVTSNFLSGFFFVVFPSAFSWSLSIRSVL